MPEDRDHRPPDETQMETVPGGRDAQRDLSPVTSDLGDETEDGQQLSFNLVGIGASAGGIEACIELLEHLPPDTGMGYVVVFHLAADQKSHLAEVLSRHTEMRVKEITSGARVEPNTIYVAMPGRALRLEGGALFLETPPPDHAQRAI